MTGQVAAKLGLTGQSEQVTVLNGQARTFESKPVNIELKSVKGDVRMKVSAYTTTRVTGNMALVDWNSYKRRWPHRRNIGFPRSDTRPIVDILIGLDCADLHYALKEVRGRAGEPVARLTPLGWTCVGKPGSNSDQILHTNFAYSFFIKEISGIEQLNEKLVKSSQIDSISPPHEMPKRNIKLSLKKEKNTFACKEQLSQVDTPRKWNSSKKRNVVIDGLR